MDYSKLFSCFGNQALEIIFNIELSGLLEHEIKLLIMLANRMKQDDRLTREVMEQLSGAGEVGGEERRRRLLLFAASIADE